MRDVVCYLISTTYESDEIGNQISKDVEQETPILKVEFVSMKEFYEANEKGLKPTLQLRLNSLNYTGQKKLRYINTIYTIIRTKNPTQDEILLICERKESDG